MYGGEANYTLPTESILIEADRGRYYMSMLEYL